MSNRNAFLIILCSIMAFQCTTRKLPSLRRRYDSDRFGLVTLQGHRDLYALESKINTKQIAFTPNFTHVLLIHVLLTIYA